MFGFRIKRHMGHKTPFDQNIRPNSHSTRNPLFIFSFLSALSNDKCTRPLNLFSIEKKCLYMNKISLRYVVGRTIRF